MLRAFRWVSVPTAAVAYTFVEGSRRCPLRCESQQNQFLTRNFVADAVEVASPSVVNIMSQSAVNSTFGLMAGTSSGSGFIIDESGFIVTNAHVVQHNSTGGRLQVTMWNGKKRNAVIHSIDQPTDLALVKLTDVAHGEELPVSILGNSSKLRTGEFVVALGSPLLLQNSVTFGIVSSTARLGTELGMRRSRLEFIQTDASINQGNSGGPLINLDGHVVGINNMKAANTDGISFAIPIDLAKGVVRQLKESGKVARPYVGLNFKPFSGGRRGDASGEVHLLVTSVEPGSPAAAAGLEAKDVIVEVDGKPMRGPQTLLNALGVEIGRSIELKVRREGGGERVVFLTTAAVPTERQ